MLYTFRSDVAVEMSHLMKLKTAAMVSLNAGAIEQF